MSRYTERQQWRKLYNSARWKRLRAMRLSTDPLCVLCRDRFKRMTPANVCDHIKPHKGDTVLFYDYANTQSLCKPCHDIHKHRAEIGSFERQEFGADGYPI